MSYFFPISPKNIFFFYLCRCRDYNVHRSRAIACEESMKIVRIAPFVHVTQWKRQTRICSRASLFSSLFLSLSHIYLLYSRDNSFAFLRWTFICINHNNVDVISGHRAFYEPLSTVSMSLVWPVESNNFIRPYQRPNVLKKARKHERSKKLLTYR